MEKDEQNQKFTTNPVIKNTTKLSKEKVDEYFQKRNKIISLISYGLYCPECMGVCIKENHLNKE